MTTTGLICLAIVLYIGATWLILTRVRKQQDDTSGRNALRHWSQRLAWGAWVLHASALVLHGALSFSLESMALIISAIIVLIFLLGCIRLEIARLGVLLFPFTVLILLFSLGWGGGGAVPQEHALLPISAFSAHVLVSILGYSFMTIAMIQSLLYTYQETQFRNRRAPAMIASLPPLQTMEQLLFRLLWIGFILLSLTLLTGALFSQQIFSQPFEFNHHTVLPILGWLVFAILLVKRARAGVRGIQATIFTLAGYALIMLGYFGTKMINESLGNF